MISLPRCLDLGVDQRTLKVCLHSSFTNRHRPLELGPRVNGKSAGNALAN